MNITLLVARFFVVIFFAQAAAVTPPVLAANSPRVFSEVFVLRSMQLIHGAQATYQATSGNGNYGSLQDLRQAGFIDEALATGSKYGYSYVLSASPWIPGNPSAPATFTLTATPRSYRKTGIRSFYIDVYGEIRGGDRNGQPATADDPVIDFDLCTNGGIQDNERCTIQSLRTLHGAEATYQATTGNGNYGSLQQLHEAYLIHSRLATGSLRGYSITVTTFPFTPGQTPATFRISAVAIIYGTTGIRSLFIATDGIIHGADKNGEPADENDPPIND
ncbi:MAG TPA: hypothetical protein VK468_10790 [Pyrinomonadaceae bacterium]|nr:hypothetical protein [Pyrinomonadaceae bacterium]